MTTQTGVPGGRANTLIGQAPRIPSRTRLLRPDIFADDVTGTLAPATLVAYLGLATRADDGGFLMWHPVALAAAVMPYADPQGRPQELERIADELVAVGLLLIHACGCAELPRLVRDLAIKGGNKTYAVRDWHSQHAATNSSVPVQTEPAESVSSSGSSSSSVSTNGYLSGPDPGDGSASASGRACDWSEPEWLDRLHRVGMPIDRKLDQTWPAWLATLKRRHADQTIYEEVERFAASGETRPLVVQDLVRVALEQRPYEP
ncbi:MAG: hypothetical protein Q7S35_05990 [Candidatus Limnocylindrales bacterium]|nr:hypothetical protein [Candidatus Limnocylindrales bacterium]